MICAKNIIEIPLSRIRYINGNESFIITHMAIYFTIFIAGRNTNTFDEYFDSHPFERQNHQYIKYVICKTYGFVLIKLTLELHLHIDKVY